MEATFLQTLEQTLHAHPPTSYPTYADFLFALPTTLTETNHKHLPLKTRHQIVCDFVEGMLVEPISIVEGEGIAAHPLCGLTKMDSIQAQILNLIILVYFEAERKKWETRIEGSRQYKKKYWRRLLDLMAFLRICMDIERISEERYFEELFGRLEKMNTSLEFRAVVRELVEECGIMVPKGSSYQREKKVEVETKLVLPMYSKNIEMIAPKIKPQEQSKTNTIEKWSKIQSQINRAMAIGRGHLYKKLKLT